MKPAALPAAMLRRLARAAIRARRRAYAPYSRFRVGAAVLAADGTVTTGCNVENASYGLTVCAERVAVQKAVSEGHRRLRAVAVVGGPDFTPPCGACRQVMVEFGVTTVVLSTPAGRTQVVALAELLPAAFRRQSRRRDA